MRLLRTSVSLPIASPALPRLGIFGDALLVQVRSRELFESVVEDKILKRSARVLEGRTLIVPSSKEGSFRDRLKELGYLLDR